MEPFRIAIASGKGGTGKTTFAVNLAYVSQTPITLLDCDVEEPNIHLFFRPIWQESEEISVEIPSVLENQCNGCGECKKHCRFNAIVLLHGKPLIAEELCHSCGACKLACPLNLIQEKPRAIGIAHYAKLDKIELVSAELNVGEARSSALIEKLRKIKMDSELVLIDAPPGTSCATISAIRDVDYLVLVTEPTPLGFHDLSMAVRMADKLKLKTGVIINKADFGSEPIKEYCDIEKVPVLGEVLYDGQLAEAYSTGEIVAKVLPEYRRTFRDIWSGILEETKK